MGRSYIADLNVGNASGSETLFVGGSLGLNNTDINGVNDIYLDDINADGSKIDLQDGMDIGSETIYSDSDNLDLNRSGVGTSPVQIGANQARAGTEEDLEVYDDLNVDGTKNAVHTTKDGRRICFSAIESGELWFEEKMSSYLEKGRKEIILDERFLASTIRNDDYPLHIIVTPTSECNGLWVEKKLDRVIVHELNNGLSNASFDITISAKRDGFEHIKFDEQIYNKESGYHYMNKKKDLFLKQKPYFIKMKKLKQKEKKLKQERRKLNKDKEKFIITGNSKEEIRKKMDNLTDKEKKELEEYRKKISKNKIERKSLKKEKMVLSDKLRKVNSDWKQERHNKWKKGLKKKDKI